VREFRLRMTTSVAVASLLLACTCAVCLGQEPGATAAGRTDSLWLGDLDFFARELPQVHKDLFFHISRAEFSAMVEDLRARIGELTDPEVVVGMMRILAAVGDSHTLLGIDHTALFGRLPMVAEWFPGGLYIVKTSPQLSAMLGRRITGIEGMPIEEVYDTLGQVIPHENHAQLKAWGPQYMAVPEILVALGIASTPDTVVFETESSGEMPIAAVAAHRRIEWVSLVDSLECDTPLYLQHEDRHYWFKYLPDPGALYISYSSCTEMDTMPFARFADRVFSTIDSLSPEKVIIDLRANGGGNSAIAQPLISGIRERPAITGKDRLFIVIGRRTFSSALLNAMELAEGGNATLVGEPTGGKPNHYGEVRFFILPNSMIPVQYSTKYFSLSEDKSPSLYPDLYAEPTFEDFKACRDPAVQTVLAR
jgi:hypothetical protein